MEMRFLNVTSRERNIENLSIDIKNNLLTGVYSNKYNLFKDLLRNEIDYSGNIFVDDTITYIDREVRKDTFLTDNVGDEIQLFSQNKEIDSNIVLKNLNIFGYSNEFLKRSISSLSKGEKKIFYLALSLSVDNNIILFEEPFLYMDRKNTLKIKNIINDLKKKKSIILFSDNINILYELCDDLILFVKNQVLIQDSLNVVFKDIDFLKNNQIPLPDSLVFQENASKYGVVLKNNKEVKDLIKDVYRNEESRKNMH